MSQAFFLTGTDTDIGKTYVASALLYRAGQTGLRTAGLKPVAAGTDAQGINDDVTQLRAASSVELPAEIVNPYCFRPFIAPHLAAHAEHVVIDFDRIARTVDYARSRADFVIVEGAGGFCIPLGGGRNSADLARQLQLPVILVVGMRLGCLNHALLTAEAVAARGLFIAGWIANEIDPEMSHFEENVDTLRDTLLTPLLGIVRHATAGGPAEAGRLLILPDQERPRSTPMIS